MFFTPSFITGWMSPDPLGCGCWWLGSLEVPTKAWTCYTHCGRRCKYFLDWLHCFLPCKSNILSSQLYLHHRMDLSPSTKLRRMVIWMQSSFYYGVISPHSLWRIMWVLLDISTPCFFCFYTDLESHFPFWWQDNRLPIDVALLAEHLEVAEFLKGHMGSPVDVAVEVSIPWFLILSVYF